MINNAGQTKPIFNRSIYHLQSIVSKKLNHMPIFHRTSCFEFITINAGLLLVFVLIPACLSKPHWLLFTSLMTLPQTPKNHRRVYSLSILNTTLFRLRFSQERDIFTTYMFLRWLVGSVFLMFHFSLQNLLFKI